MESESKLSDELETWYKEYPERWTVDIFVTLDNGNICQSIVGKAARILGVPITSKVVNAFEETGRGHEYLRFEDYVTVTMDSSLLQDVLDKYAQSVGLWMFPTRKVMEANNNEGFKAALGVMRDLGM